MGYISYYVPFLPRLADPEADQTAIYLFLFVGIHLAGKNSLLVWRWSLFCQTTKKCLDKS